MQCHAHKELIPMPPDAPKLALLDASLGEELALEMGWDL